MIRVSKLTDYGILLMSHLAQGGRKSFSARELSLFCRLPLPTVSKVLKVLAKQNLVTSYRGVLGGYQLSRMPSDISVAEMIYAFEGPIAITDCSVDKACGREQTCKAKGPWQRINMAINDALAGLSLADMTGKRNPGEMVTIRGIQRGL